MSHPNIYSGGLSVSFIPFLHLFPVREDGTLYIGNRVCLNTRSPGQVYNRVGPDQGLPTGNITAVGVGTGGGPPLDPSRRQQVWLGTAFGVEVWTMRRSRKREV